ncbi:SIR2 family protein [Methylobacterium sp. ID0610]|uniref:SIR2 family protein n=1 Tax=Methylobacterium carpenticola TaxID=3344827 RepID=UPI003682DB5C
MNTSRPLALVGAGASLASGYPSWPKLLEKMQKNLIDKNLLPPKLPPILEAINDPAWQAEELCRRMDPGDFATFITETFQAPLALREPHHRIARLGFRHVLTTNYDPCIEIAMKQANLPFMPIHWSDPADVRKFFFSLSDTTAQSCIVYLHGRYDKPEHIVLTESSYARSYLNDIFQRRMIAVFMTQPVVFIGFSMQDPELSQILRVVRANLGDEATQHYGIFGYRTEHEKELIARRMEAKFGLRAVFYRIDTTNLEYEDHSGLIALLDRIRDGRALDEGGGAEAAPFVPEVEAALPLAKDKINDVDPLDPNKGRFGGLPETVHRRLRVADIEEIGGREYLAFTLIVESKPGEPRLTGRVQFHLHPTFPRKCYTETARNGSAKFRIDVAYGAFTVGVVIERDPAGANRLELDLSEVPAFPQWFRER